MKDIIVYGSGGMAREVVWLIEEINKKEHQWNIIGFIDDIKGDCKEVINGYRILGTHEILKQLGRPLYLALAISDPGIKESIYHKIKDLDIVFPILVHPTARVCENASMDEGTIIGIDCIVSTNVKLGKHVFLNMRTVVGHDAVINDFCSCLVNCIIAGDVTVGEGALLGSNCVIMEKKRIGRNSRVSLGSVVSFDVEDGHVVLSKPSKSMFFGK